MPRELELASVSPGGDPEMPALITPLRPLIVGRERFQSGDKRIEIRRIKPELPARAVRVEVVAHRDRSCRSRSQLREPSACKDLLCLRLCTGSIGERHGGFTRAQKRSCQNRGEEKASVHFPDPPFRAGKWQSRIPPRAEPVTRRFFPLQKRGLFL